MIKHILQSSLSNKIRDSIHKGIYSYKNTYNGQKSLIPNEEILVEEILGALGDSIEDMLDIIKQGFTK